MNFDWTKPVVIDWTGRSGPLITEHDIKNSVIKRILRNQYCAPLCERQYLRAKPWWNPQDPYGSQLGTINLYKNDRFIPGLHTAPAYPQTSTLTKLQHHHGLRVLNAKYQNVQPSGYPQPSQKDHAVFEEIKELYEAEQKEYVKWAKLLWVNGDCIRALRPKPAIEKVYDAEFKMRMHEIQSMPQNYVLAAQIPLETKNDSFDLEHKGDLIDVNVLDLPQLDYPEEMESDFSILLKSCPVPEPCAEHPCKFVLPNEDSVSVLPLSEIHRELAQYAVNNGSTFVASENALRCLLETDRAWKIPLSVVEVVCPEYGDLRTVVVLGSEFVVQKESSKRRTYKAYKHLLQHTFAPSTGHSKSKTATNTPQKTLNPTDTKVAPRLNRCVSLDDDLEVSSDDNDDDKLLIDDNEPSSEPKKSKDRCKPISEPDSCNDQRCEPSNEQEIDECAHEPNSEPDILFIDNNIEGSQEPNKEFDQLLVANASKVNPDPLDLYEPNYRNDTNEARPSYSHDHDESNSKPDRLFVDDASKGNQELSFYEPNSNDTRTNSETSKIQNFCEPNYGNTIRPSYSLDEPNSSPDRLMVNYEENTRQPGFNQDFWKPNYNCYSDSNDSEDGNATNEPSNNIEEPSCSELDTDKLCAKLFQTNKDATPSLLEINQDASEKNENAIKRVFVNNENASQMNVDAAPSLFKTNDDSFEFNEDAAQSLFGTNEDTSESNVNRPKMQEDLPLDLYEPNYRNDTNEARPSYSHDHDESNSKPDRLFVDDASKGNQELSFYEPNSNDTRTNSETSKIQNFCEPNYGNTIRPSYSLDEPNSSPDRLMVNYEENTRQPGFNQDFWKPNYNCYSDSNDSEDGNATNEPSNNIEEPSCSELDTDKLCAKLFQTNKDATPSLLEINQDASEKNENAIKRVFVNNENASQMNVDAAPSLFKTNDDSFEFNEDAAQSLFGTNEDTSESNVNRPKMQESPGTTTTLLTKVYSNGPITTDVTCDVSSNPTKPSDTNESTLASDEPITSDTNNSPNTLSPTKPCTISVRNLTGLLIFPNSSNGNSTKIPLKSERNKSVCGTDGNASGNNDTIIENSKAPYSRLGISGVITRNRRIVGANESSEKVTEATTRLGIPGKVTRNRHISLTSNVTEVNDPIITENTTKVSTIKPATRRRGRISNANAAEVIEHSETNKAFDFGANELEKKGAEVSPEIARRRSVRINKANVAEVLEPTSEINKARVIRVNDPIEKDTEVITNTVRRSVRISNNYIVEDIDPPTRKTKKEDVETTVQPIKNNSELSPVKPCSVTVKQDIDPFARKRNFSATNSVIPEVIELINEKANNAILKPNTRKPSITYTNTTVAEVNEPTKKTSEVPMKSPVRPVTRKQRISSINNEVAKVIEPINKEPNKASLKPNSRKLRISESNTTVTVIEPIAENTAEVINKSPSSCCEPSLQNARNISVSVPVSESGPRNICSIETEASCITNYSLSNEPGNKRVRKLRNREHDYNQFKPENARTESRKLSMTGIEHSDGISPKPSLSFDETNSNQHDSGPISVTIDDIATIPKNPGDRKLKFNVTASAKTEKPSCNKSKPDIRNFKPLSYATKSRSDKMNLFGDKSDNVELICNASCINNVKENMTKSDFKKIGATILRTESSDHSLDSRTITESSTMPDTRKLRFSEPTDEKPSDIENNSLKPFLEKSISESPKNGKRKLSFRDPLTSDPELDASFREADNEDAIAGFNNGVPVLYTSLQKNPKKKQKNNATCTYELRNKPKPTIPKKSKTTVKKDNIVLTEIDPPETQYNTRSGAQRRISYSNSDDSDYSKCSKSISSVSKEKNKTNKQKNTENVLRKNRSIPTRANVKESDDPPTNKTYAKDKATTEGIRRSRRLSVLTKENVQPISNITKTVNYNPSSSFGKITKDKRRRKSLPANIFSDADNMNRVTRSRSLNNFNDIAKTGKNKTSRSISRSKCTPLNTEKDNSLKLTERTKRNLRRVFNSDNSETEQSEDETSECTQRYNRTPISSSCLEKSDSEINKRSNRYCTRSSSTASYAIKTSNSKRKACKNNENSLSERTKRHIRLSAAAAYSSCDETDKPNRIARKKTKIQPGAIRDTIDSSVNKLDSSSAMKINEKQSNSQLKTEVMDFTENLERKNNEMDQSTAVPANESSIATFEIKIDVFEETDESNDETMKVLHFTELNQMEMCEENSSYTEIVSNQNSQDKNNLNETEVEKSNLFYLKSNVMDVSDSDAEFYDSQSYTLATTNGLSRDVIDETIDRPQNDHELIKTEPDFNDTNATDTTSNDGTRPRKNSISEASDSSDYFDMNETDELNMFHFTATTETDSDESDEENLLIVENSQSDTAQTNTVVETDNNQTVEEQYPAQENDVKSSVTEQTKTRHIKPNDGTVNETNDMHQSVQSQEDKIDCNVTQTLNKTDNTTEDREKSHSSKVLSCHNEALDTNTPSRENNKDIVGVYNCTCKGTPFEVPPPRSFKKWQVRAKTSNLGFDMIVHSSHRARQGAREMVLEPIVEYQPELGGCRLPAGRLRALALALLLRHSAGLLNVRVDHDNGNVIVVDKMTHDEFVARHGDKRSDIADTLHTTLNQLRFLRPGQYVLAHDSSHGPNAMLYTTKGAQRGDGTQALSLHQENINMSDAEDAIFAKAPPELDSVLLPYHKFRSILPLAFTTHKNQVKEDKKIAVALAKAKLPPQAIQWPKKKKKNKKPRPDRPAQSSQQD